MPVTPADFEYVRAFVRDHAGLVLDPGKEYLVDARLSGLARRENVESIAALVQCLRANPAAPLGRRVIEVMTTNETSFFRDQHPFDALKRAVLPALVASRSATRSLSIWCAASSSGQEPYTIAMTMLETCPELANWQVTFVATDISSEMLARSRSGTYNQAEVDRGLPADLKAKYFDRVGADWQVKERVRRMIDFRELNLTKPWPAMPAMDLVFMRNVLIYFDPATKKDILGRVRRVLRPDGYLFLGCAETTMSLDDAYARAPFDKSGCYRPIPPPAKAA